MLYPGHGDLLMDIWTNMKDGIMEFGIQQCSVWREALQVKCSDVTTLSEGIIYIIYIKYLIQYIRPNNCVRELNR